MKAFNVEHVTRLVLAGAPGATEEAAKNAIVQAQHTLDNLVHYQSGRAHYDDDVAYLARVLVVRSAS